MSDDLNDRGGTDRKLIALGEDYEVRYWTKRFGVTEDQLRKAVQDVGNSAAEVEKHLAQK